MTRRTPVQPLPPLELAPSSGLAIPTQVYLALRAAVLAGRLPPGARLPSTRDLARTLRVSRNGVVQAFEQLIAEGYVESHVGSGTRVTERVPRLPRRPAAAGSLRLSAAARRARRVPLQVSPWHGPLRPFRVGTPALGAAPIALWGRLLRAACLDARASALDYGDPFGCPDLRRALAERLFRTRAVACDPDQIAIVSGSQQAIDLVARLILDPGDEVWLEDPGYIGARGAWGIAGARLVPVAVDAAGIDVARGERLAPRARLAYVTPSHQFPTGVTMSLERRLALLAWARRTGGIVVEDDYDSEFRYDGRPLAALYGLAEGARVVYIGTFSKALFPALRLGFVVVPPDLVEPLRAVRYFADSFPPTLVQQAAARLLTDGHFDRHLRRALELYRLRRAALLEAAKRHLAGLAEVTPVEAGLHAVAWLPAGVDDRRAALAAAAGGVDAIAVSAFALRPPPRAGLVLGFAAFTPRQIEAGVERLAAALAPAR